jgi:hypothetical protein
MFSVAFADFHDHQHYFVDHVLSLTRLPMSLACLHFKRGPRNSDSVVATDMEGGCSMPPIHAQYIDGGEPMMRAYKVVRIRFGFLDE